MKVKPKRTYADHLLGNRLLMWAVIAIVAAGGGLASFHINKLFYRWVLGG